MTETAAPHMTAAELLAKMRQGQKDTTRAAVELAFRDLERSRNHAVREYDGDVSAAHWLGVIAADLAMLPLIARQTSEATGVMITGMEALTLAEAEAVVSVSGPEQLNSWVAAHSHNPAWPDARAAGLALYAVALGIARVILGETLRIIERVGG
jgi:hypothetical protein